MALPLTPTGGSKTPTPPDIGVDIAGIVGDTKGFQAEILGEKGGEVSLSEAFQGLPLNLPASMIGELGQPDPKGWDSTKEVGKTVRQ